MADTNTRITISALDQTGAAFDSIRQKLSGVESMAGKIGVTLSAVGTLYYFQNMIKSSIDAADALAKLSRQTGNTVEDLSGLKFAAEQNGTSLEVVAQATKKLGTALTDNKEIFAKFGVTAKDGIGAMVQLSDIFAAMPDGLEKSALAAKIFGKSVGPDLIEFMSQGSRSMQEFMTQGKKMSGVTAESTAQAKEFKDQLAAMEFASNGLSMQMAAILLPGLTSTATEMAKLAKEGHGVLAILRGIAGIGKIPIDLIWAPEDLKKSLTYTTRLAELKEKLAALDSKINGAGTTFQAGRDRKAALIAESEIINNQIKATEGLIRQEKEKAQIADAPVKDGKKGAALSKGLKDPTAAATEAAMLKREQDRVAKETAEARIKSVVDLHNEANAIKDKAVALEIENSLFGVSIEMQKELRLAKIDEQISNAQIFADSMRQVEAYRGIVSGIDAQIAALKRLRGAEEGKKTWETMSVAEKLSANDARNPFSQAGQIDSFKTALEKPFKDFLTGANADWNRGVNAMAKSFVDDLVNKAATIAVDAAAKTEIGGLVMLIVAAMQVGFGLFNEWTKRSSFTDLQGNGRANSGQSQEQWTKAGGWFTATENEIRSRNLSVASLTTYNAAIQSQHASFIAVGNALGYSKVSAQAFNVNLRAGDKVVNDLANYIGKQLVPALALFQREGEDLSVTAQRMTDSFRATNNLLLATGVNAEQAFGGFGLRSAAARESIIAASGGLSSFSQNANSFIDNFLTPAQKLKPALDEVAQTFNNLGIQGVTTNQQFADLVKQQLALGNTTVVAELLSVADSFNSISKSASDANQQINALLNKENFATIVDFQRAKALAGAGSIADAQLAAAQTSVRDATGTASFTNQNAGLIALANQQNAPSINLGQGSPTESGIEQLWRKLVEWLNQFGQFLNNIFNGIGTELNNFMNSFGEEFNNFMNSFGEEFNNLFNSLGDEFNNFMNSIGTELGNFGDSIGTEFNNFMNSLGSELNNLWNSFGTLPQQIVDALKGAVGSLNPFSGGGGGGYVGKVVSTVSEFVSDILSDPRAKDNISPTGIQKNGFQLYDFSYKNDPRHTMYRGVMADEVKRVRPDAVHRDISSGYDKVNYSALGLRMEKLASFAVGTNYLPQDMVAQVHKGERIIPAADNRELMERLRSPSAANDALIAEVRALRAEVSQLRFENTAAQRELVRDSRANNQLYDKWDGEGLPPTRIAA